MSCRYVLCSRRKNASPARYLALPPPPPYTWRRKVSPSAMACLRPACVRMPPHFTMNSTSVRTARHSATAPSP